MPIHTWEIPVKTHKREEILDISEKIFHLVNEARKLGINDGVCRIFVPHTTAGITINENADPAVEKDMASILSDLVPRKSSYLHMEGNSDSHVKASLMGFSCEFILKDGRMLLGTWQGIKFCEFDGPRNRKVFVQIMGE